MPNEIDTLAARAIEQNAFPGCVVATVGIGERDIRAYGTLAYGEAETREDTVYDLASVTKSIPVASLVLECARTGSLTLQDLVRTWIPELRNDRAATIEDLLRYRVYGPRLSELAHLPARDITEAVMLAGFEELPGEPQYSNLPAFLLGIILERATGHTIDALAQEIFFGPLNMQSTFFPVAGSAIDPGLSIAPTETEEAGDVHGIVHDESARAFARAGRAVGHAGLFSNAPDLCNFVESLLAGGFPAIVKGAQLGLGWELNRGVFMGRHFGPRTFGKTGFTGTSVVIDCDRKRGLVILSNRTYPSRPADTSAINAFRSAVAETVFRG